MSWIRGIASNYLDLSNVIVEAATEESLATVDSIAAGGSSYVVGDILTLSGGTFTVAAQVEVITVSSGAVTAVRRYNDGIYTVTPTDPVSTTGGTGTGCTLNCTFVENGWVAELDNTYSGSERQVVLRGEGGGTDAIYVGWRTFSSVPGGYYNFELHGFTGYDGDVSFSEQLGASPGFWDASVDVNRAGAYLLCHNTSVQYWMSINSYRIILIVKVGSAYFNAYLGWGNQFGTVGEMPYPMCIAGHTSELAGVSSQSKLSSGLTDPWRSNQANTKGPMFILATDNNWYDVANGIVDVGSRSVLTDRVVLPTQNSKGSSDNSVPAEDKFMDSSFAFQNFILNSGLSGNTTAFLNETPGQTSAVRVLIPTVIVMFSPVQIVMELDDVYWMSAFGTPTSGDRVIISGQVYRVFQNCNRTDSYAYLAVKEN